mmetsp:Transcript_14045/g.28833  ORF Transcript_14045/g.28833 Transcript_14045/m.28833 type:complete len:864 (+) Transcript_14045:93-2684(+)
MFLLSKVLLLSLSSLLFLSPVRATVKGTLHPECEYNSTCWSNEYIREHSCQALAEGGAVLNSTHIEIGISAVLSGGDAVWEISSNAATFLAIDEINNSSDILPGITIVPTFADDSAEYIKGFLSGLCLAKRSVPVIVGPQYSDGCLGAAAIASREKVPILSQTCSNPKLDNRDPESGYPYFTRTFLSDSLQGPALAGIAKEYGWSSVVIVNAENDAYSQGLSESFSVTAEANNIEIPTSITIAPTETSESASLISKLNIIKSTGSRVIYMIVGANADAVKVIKAAKALGMTGEGWTWVGCDAWLGNTLDGLEETDKIGIVGTRPDFDFNSVGWRSFETNWQAIPASGFHRKYDLDDHGNDIWPFYGQNPLPTDNQWPAYNYDAIHVIGRALDKIVTDAGTPDGADGWIAKIRNPDILTTAIRSVEIPNAASAPIAFNSMGEMAAGGFNLYNYQNSGWVSLGTISIPNVTAPGVIDFDNSLSPVWGGEVTVAPASRVCTLDDYEYAVTECDESSVTKSIQYTLKTGVLCTVDAEGGIPKPADVVDISCAFIPRGSGIASISLLCGVVGMLIGVFWAFFAFSTRKSPMMRSSQPLFCVLFAFFMGMVNITSILETGEHTDGACMLREVAFHIFFTLGFGAILCKIYRVVAIFSNIKLKKIVVRDIDLLGNMAKLVLVDAIILVAWSVIDPPLATIETETVKGISFEQIVCKSDNGSFSMLAYVYKIVILLFGMNMAYRSRNFNHFAESKELGTAIYCVVLLSVVAAVAFAFMEYQGQVIIRALISLLATVTSLSAFFIPKFMKRNMSPEEYRIAVSNSTGANTGTSTGQHTSTSSHGGDSEKEELINDLKQEIENLKAELQQTKA